MAERSKTGQFLPGHKGVGGRPKRSGQIERLLRGIGDEIDPNTGKSRLEGVMRNVYAQAEQGRQWAVEFIAERTEGKVKEFVQPADKGVGEVEGVTFKPSAKQADG